MLFAKLMLEGGMEMRKGMGLREKGIVEFGLFS